MMEDDPSNASFAPNDGHVIQLVVVVVTVALALALAQEEDRIARNRWIDIIDQQALVK
jgi:hypothetical protein